MKFKIGKSYRVISHNASFNCIGCVLKYEGEDKVGNYGIPIKLGKACQPNDWKECAIFQEMIDQPNIITLVEHIDMIKFCKKLRKQRSKSNEKRKI